MIVYAALTTVAFLVIGIILVGIFMLMGVIPLIGWGGATLSKLGRKVIAPLIVTALFTASQSSLNCGAACAGVSR